MRQCLIGKLYKIQMIKYGLFKAYKYLVYFRAWSILMIRGWSMIIRRNVTWLFITNQKNITCGGRMDHMTYFTHTTVI